MPNVILLAAQQAQQVAGILDEQPRYAALGLTQLAQAYQGTYTHILGASVLADPAHAEDAAFPSALPQLDQADVQSLIPSSP